jgi:hypothetical protein
VVPPRERHPALRLVALRLRSPSRGCPFGLFFHQARKQGSRSAAMRLSVVATRTSRSGAKNLLDVVTGRTLYFIDLFGGQCHKVGKTGCGSIRYEFSQIVPKVSKL